MRLAQETWTGSDGSAWPAQWTTSSAGTGVAPTIVSNRGRLDPGSGGSYGGFSRAILNGVRVGNVDITGDIVPNLFVEEYVNICARTTGDWASNYGPTSGYSFQYSVGTPSYQITKFTAGAQANLGTISRNDGIPVSFRFRLDGSTLRCRAWALGTAEPSTWDITATDTAYTAGSVQVINDNGAAATVTRADLDNFEIQDFALVYKSAVYGATSAGYGRTAVIQRRHR